MNLDLGWRLLLLVGFGFLALLLTLVFLVLLISGSAGG